MIAGIGAVLPQFLALVVLLAAAYVPLGNWIARSYTSDKDWAIERAVYKVLRVDPNRGHNSKNYSCLLYTSPSPRD